MTIRNRTVFDTKAVRLADTTEQVVVGGRDKFPLLPQALAGNKTFGFIGWGSQGPAQSQNFRDALASAGMEADILIGLQAGSSSIAKAEAAGFGGATGEMYDVIGKSDVVLLLIKDAAQAENLGRIQKAMKPGATLGLSHGFLIGHMKNIGAEFRSDINVVGMCPKGMGPSVRRLFQQGAEVNGAGINSSFAVEQDVTGKAENIALAWAVATGSPYVFPTTLEMEYRSDIAGERGVLLGGVWGILEALFVESMFQTKSGQEAFQRSAGSLTGPISTAISEGGLLEVGYRIATMDHDLYYRAMRASYIASRALFTEIYEEVKSGREIASVIDATKRLEEYPFSKVDGSYMWRIGALVRKNKIKAYIDPTTAGVYVGEMMAQVDVLRANGHVWNEICNESIIEAVDSLNPYMAARGVDYMVDNCSTTARLGTRKWGPRWQQMVSGDVLPNLDSPTSHSCEAWFKDHPVHNALAECMRLRPSVRIAVD